MLEIMHMMESSKEWKNTARDFNRTRKVITCKRNRRQLRRKVPCLSPDTLWSLFLGKACGHGPSPHISDERRHEQEGLFQNSVLTKVKGKQNTPMSSPLARPSRISTAKLLFFLSLTFSIWQMLTFFSTAYVSNGA